MTLSGDYEPSPWEWVRNQVAEYEATGGARANTLGDTGRPVIILTTRGNKSGMIRKTPLMRVEHQGEWALVGSMGGAPNNPVWVYNLRADPTAAVVRDGAEAVDVVVRELSSNERDQWWQRAVDAYPDYADYQAKTDRQIPVFLATPRA